jgi:hypothetical protein
MLTGSIRGGERSESIETAHSMDAASCLSDLRPVLDRINEPAPYRRRHLESIVSEAQCWRMG